MASLISLSVMGSTLLPITLSINPHMNISIFNFSKTNAIAGILYI
ncbi:hypothetical protein [Nostoc commune]|nr:hypothetical protein [Nostoc commune]